LTFRRNIAQTRGRVHWRRIGARRVATQISVYRIKAAGEARPCNKTGGRIMEEVKMKIRFCLVCRCNSRPPCGGRLLLAGLRIGRVKARRGIESRHLSAYPPVCGGLWPLPTAELAHGGEGSDDKRRSQILNDRAVARSCSLGGPNARRILPHNR